LIKLIRTRKKYKGLKECGFFWLKIQHTKLLPNGNYCVQVRKQRTGINLKKKKKFLLLKPFLMMLPLFMKYTLRQITVITNINLQIGLICRWASPEKQGEYYRRYLCRYLNQISPVTNIEPYRRSRLFGQAIDITYKKKFYFQTVTNSKQMQILINIGLCIDNINRHSLLYSENEV
jgi:hypothetical protein